LISPVRGGRVVCEIDKLRFKSDCNNALTRLVFPAPDGALMINKQPVVCVISYPPCLKSLFYLELKAVNA